MTTIHASSATKTAAYYTRYLTAGPGEVPGVWCGRQADCLGLLGTVEAEPLELLLSGRDPVSRTPLGRELVDRVTRDGRVVKAVSGFDATFSAPKSVSVWWALTGDHRLLEAHDVAVKAVLEHLERVGSTTRIRRDGGRLHPDTGGLTMATFRQTTSRADDPQIHTHAVISAKVQTDDGCWRALDARYLKRNQRMLGALYQSVLRSELTHRFGVAWGPIVNGQAEIAGTPKDLLAVFSKRGAAIDVALAAKIDEFRQREGRDPSGRERGAMGREASEDTRGRKSAHGPADLVARWEREAADAGQTVDRLLDAVERAARTPEPSSSMTVADVVTMVSAQHSSWGRADVVQAICDVQRPVSQMSGRRWLDTVERAADRVVAHCVDLDPAEATRRRASDGRSLWIEPTAPHLTSEAVLAEEEHVVSWAIDAHADTPSPSTTVNCDGLDVLQADAAASVAGHDRLALVVGPAGAGKTRMLAAAVADLDDQRRGVFGLAATAKAAQVLQRDTAMRSDTVAKLLHEWRRGDRAPLPEYQLSAGTTVVVDEAGMLSTPTLHHLVTLAEANRWRLVLVGDHRRLQAVGRGGLFAELCANGRVNELELLHRFTHHWEAAASLLLRSGNPKALDAYEAHDRIIPDSLDAHLERMATTWIAHHDRGETVGLVASTNDHVDAINRAVQAARIDAGHLGGSGASIAGGEHVHVGDIAATRRNDRTLITSAGEPVRNRETWTVTAMGGDGSLTVNRERGNGSVTLPADYAREHVRLGYAATEHGYQSDTVDHSIALTSSVTTRRGLYVAATRGRDENLLCVVTDSDNVAEARDVLEAILAFDRNDVPAVTQRRILAHQQPVMAPPDRPAAAPRCDIPEWFEAFRRATGGDLAAAEQAATASAVLRSRLAESVAAAERHLAQIEAATAPARRALNVATRRVDQASIRHTEAQNDLESAGIRGRRQARRNVELAALQLERATRLLAGIRRSAEPQVDHYQQAQAQVEAARTARHRHLNTARRGREHVAVLRRRVDTIDRWQQWVEGEPLSTTEIASLTEQLATDGRRGKHTGQFMELSQAIGQWAATVGDEPRRTRRVEHVGPEIDL